MMRFYVRPDGLTAEWLHELDPLPPGRADWFDCTEMDDEEFTNFVTALQTLL